MSVQSSFVLWATATLGLMLVLLAGCGSKSAGRSTLTTTIGPRTVKATVDGGGFISSEGGTAIISSGAGKILVEKDRVVQDDKELTKIPAAATKIDVDYTKGALTVSADGVQVYPAAAAK